MVRPKFGDLLCGFHAITLADVLRFSETRWEFKSAFNRAAGAASITEQSRWTAKSAGSYELTFDTKDEIIISSGSQVLSAKLTLFSPSSAFIHPS
jgi:hypothetical protein